MLFRSQVKQAAEQAEQVQQVRRALIDMNNLIEQLRMELANVRGGNEQAMRDISELQRRFRDVQVGLDQRLVKLEPAKVVLDGREFLADPEEKRSYDAAVEQFRRGDFAEAAKSLQAFQRRYPQSGYSDSVWFWLGNAHFGKRDYREAVMASGELALTSSTPDSGTSCRSARMMPPTPVIGAATNIVATISTSNCTCCTSLVVRVINEGAPNWPTSRCEKQQRMWLW